MFRGHRIALFAAFGWLLLAADKPPTEQLSGKADTAEQKQRLAQPEPRTLTPPPAVHEAPPYVPYKDRNADPCYYAKNHDSADLCAQWRAALAAEKAAQEARTATIWAAFATLLSAIGVAGLIYTIWQTNGALGEARRGNRISLLVEKRSRREAREAAADTKETVAEAKRSATAMTKMATALTKQLTLVSRSTEISQQIADTQKRVSETQLRAYLSVIIGHAIYQETDKNLRFEARPLLVNSGQTPALNVRHQTRAAIIQIPLPTDIDFPLPLLDGLAEDILPPNQNRIMSGVVTGYVPEKDIERVLWGNGLGLYVWGVVAYDDVFGQPHTVEFCQHLTWLNDKEGKPTEVMGYYIPGRNKAD